MKIQLNRGIKVPLGVGVVATALTVVYGLFDTRRALVAWIAAFGFGISTVLGALILVMVFHVTGALWWRALRRVIVSLAGTVPIFVILFVPIAVSLTLVYPWHTPPPDVSEHVKQTLEHQRTWNNPGFFLARSFLYLGLWTVLAGLLRRADTAPPSRENTRREREISGVGLVIIAFTLTFASFDWLMSMQAAWVSNMFGVYVFTSGLAGALSVTAVASWLAGRTGLLPEGVGPDHFHAIGRLMLMAVILWTYIGFFQLMLVWIANLPHEVAFYSARTLGSWSAVDWLLFGGRFLVPFFALLSRPLKRSPVLLAGVGVWLFLSTMLDFAWMVLPAVSGRLSPADFLPFVAIAGLVWAYAAHLAYTRGRVPAEPRAERAIDPTLQEALRYRSP